MKGIDKIRQMREAGELQNKPNKNPEEKSNDNPTSLRLAINAKCYDCNGKENWVKRTRECNISSCSLWKVRPFR